MGGLFESPWMWGVLLLALLAGFDLMVGVVNDAVNFLNAAFGSKVTSRRIILIVAGIGIFVGAAFSSGMMEITRSGVFNPAVLSYYDVMMIFFAVVIVDILLLDFYNSLGLQTSTTVSIIFELLGAGLGVALIYLFGQNLPVLQVAEYINATSVVRIVSGIFLSIIISFSVGYMMQAIVRYLFSFTYDRLMQKWGFLYGAISIAGILYFLIIKGLKGLTFIPAEFIVRVGDNTWILLGYMSFALAIVLGILQKTININILKVVVLTGTFAIAAAFASNDLVNFIGVSVAGRQSTMMFLGQSLPADEFMMSALATKMPTPWFLLFGAAILMILALTYSKKAVHITQTELGLTTHHLGDERFVPGPVSRWILKYSIKLKKMSSMIMPNSIQKNINNRFDATGYVATTTSDYDLLRASIILTLSAVLISIATSMKLPLSTTYVTFMVAMGAALADGARGRDSAIFRISGMITVIVGWLLTGVLAFFSALIIVIILWHSGGYGVGIMMIFTGYLLYRSHRRTSIDLDQHTSKTNTSVKEMLGEDVKTTLHAIENYTSQLLHGFITGDISKIQTTHKDIKNYVKQIKSLKQNVHNILTAMGHEQSLQEGHHYVFAIETIRRISIGINSIGAACSEYLLNCYPDYLGVQKQEISDVYQHTITYIKSAPHNTHYKAPHFLEWIAKGDALFEHMESLKKIQLERIKQKEVGVRNTNLYFTIMTELYNIILNFQKLVKRSSML